MLSVSRLRGPLRARSRQERLEAELVGRAGPTKSVQGEAAYGSRANRGGAGEVRCKGNEPCTSYSRTFTIHNYGYGIAYTFTHNNITLEHTAMNDKNTIAHTDAYNTQF